MEKLTGIELIAEERQRQIEKEGYTHEHDSEHDGGELAIAGACYALPHEKRNGNARFVGTPEHWPFHEEYWKPTPELRVRELVKAGALIAAEIDRLNHLKEK